MIEKSKNPGERLACLSANPTPSFENLQFKTISIDAKK